MVGGSGLVGMWFGARGGSISDDGRWNVVVVVVIIITIDWVNLCVARI